VSENKEPKGQEFLETVKGLQIGSEEQEAIKKLKDKVKPLRDNNPAPLPVDDEE
jgi:hypothetical protein